MYRTGITKNKERNMSFDRNDIVTKKRLGDALKKEIVMGFEHNDIVTMDVMNKAIEEGGGGGGGSPWDAVIRLTHADNSGQDTPENLTPSITSGTFADLYAKLSDGGCPCVLVEYMFPIWGIAFSAPMAYITYVSDNGIAFAVAGYSIVDEAYATYGTLHWNSDGTLTWS